MEEEKILNELWPPAKWKHENMKKRKKGERKSSIRGDLRGTAESNGFGFEKGGPYKKKEESAETGEIQEVGNRKRIWKRITTKKREERSFEKRGRD
ncbi:hypothetical protein VIGAN_03210400 [Vigna angularis var. angularis]|uniref:Uncharacterized protein n=1 Tax=Vigna angularis var. angularis TaxID=157739 RepID=A0A0S3RNH4_PHAAN|nr:hypothetical protein VIGAN_03210400 [Vigna angularis var. angularis]